MAENTVVNFLDEHNRPFSLTDIHNGIKGDLPKSAVQKALDSLVEKGRVKEKTYGKQKVYFISRNTDQTPKELSEQILALDRQINEITANLREVEGKVKSNEVQYEQNKGKLSFAETCQKKEGLESELKILKGELKEFNGVNLVEPGVKKRIQENYDKHLGIYRKRKRLCLDILDAILENYPKTKKHLYEDIGIETDEDVGFSFDQ